MKTTSTYFLLSPVLGMVKIGKSRHVRQRVSNLRTSSPTPLIVLGTLASDEEERLHKRFAACRAHGEWFRLTDELANWLLEQFPTQEKAISTALLCAEDVKSSEHYATAIAEAELSQIQRAKAFRCAEHDRVLYALPERRHPDFYRMKDAVEDAVRSGWPVERAVASVTGLVPCNERTIRGLRGAARAVERKREKLRRLGGE